MREFPFSFQHNRLLPRLPTPTPLLPCILVQNLPISLYCCYNGCVSQISCRDVDDKYTFSTQTNIQTICNDKYTDSISTHKHWQNAMREKSVLCSYTGHCNVTRRVSFCHPPINNVKILIKIFKCSPGKGFLSVCCIIQNILTQDVLQPFVYFRQYYFTFSHRSSTQSSAICTCALTKLVKYACVLCASETNKYDKAIGTGGDDGNWSDGKWDASVLLTQHSMSHTVDRQFPPSHKVTLQKEKSVLLCCGDANWVLTR